MKQFLLPDGIDALIVNDPNNRQYLTGVHSSAGTVLVFRDKTYLIIDFRYIEMATKTASCEVILQDKLYAQINELFTKHGVKTYTVLQNLVSLAEAHAWQQNLQADFVNDDRAQKVMDDMRMIKTEFEVNCIKQAQVYTDKCFENILNFIRPGVTEREIALQMEFDCRKQGSEGVAFDFIVVSGPNSSKPHGVPGERVVQAGDFITMDFGCRINGYCSDMTRTIAVGHVTDEMQKVYDIVYNANLEGHKAAVCGNVCNLVDKAARDYIASFGYGEAFGHGLGHGIGLDIHELPNFNRVCETVIAPGMILSVEPGIYLPGKFGVRIEDMILTTEDKPINLTYSPKNLIVL